MNNLFYMERKLKVVWVTHFSNQKIRNHLVFRDSLLERFLRELFNRRRNMLTDSCQWITNGINEYEKIEDVELHIVAPHVGIKGVQEFELDSIHYHFFRSEDDYSFIKRRLINPKIRSEFRKNRTVIKRMIDNIQPSVVHVIGAENPKYSLAALDVNTDEIPLVVSLQTLMSAPEFKKNYFLPNDVYEFRSECERDVLRHTQFVGSRVKMFKDVIWKDINPDAVFFNIDLFLGETIYKKEFEKRYDIIYFAKDIVKAVDIALNVMVEVIKQRPDTKMCIVGGCNAAFKDTFYTMIDVLGLQKHIDYLGCLPTHEDVLSTVRSARVALLPVKIESICGTMREAMANGVPLVTTKTWGTPFLNKNRKTALIREQIDYAGLAEDVVALLDDKVLYDELKENGYLLMEEYYSNAAFARVHNELYRALVNKYEQGRALPVSLCSYNPEKRRDNDGL